MSHISRTQTDLEKDLDIFHQKEALKLLGWLECGRVWFPPIESGSITPMLFDSACEKAGLKQGEPKKG